MNFFDYSSQIVEKVEQDHKPIVEVDALTFLTSPEYQNEQLLPIQRVIIKTLYNLWPIYPPDEDEQVIVDVLQNEWNISLDLARTDPVKFLVLILGRRSSKCLTGDTQLLNANTGEYFTIKEMLGNNVNPAIFTLGKNYKLQKTINYTCNSNGVKPVYELVLRSGRKIKATLNHPFLTVRGWKNLEDLKVLDRIAITKKYEINNQDQLTEDEAALLGYVTGDGNTLTYISFTNFDSEIVKEYTRIVTNLSCCLRHYGRGGYTAVSNQFHVKSTRNRVNKVLNLVRSTELYGKKAICKDIPSIIFQSSNKILGIYLNKLFSCDGNICVTPRRGYINYSTSSVKLAYSVQQALLRFGIDSKVKKYKAAYFNKKYNEKRYFDSYNITINTAKGVISFYENIGFTGEKVKRLEELYKKMLLVEIDNRYITTIPKETWVYIKELQKKHGLTDQEMRNIGGMTPQWSISPTKLKKLAIYFNDTFLLNLCDNDIIWDEIKGIEYAGEEETYDLSVPETHNFIANDIVVHNSTTISFIATYEAYSLICKDNPQNYYGIRDRHPIHIMHVAAAGDQAEDVFTFTKNNIRNNPFFRPYIDFSKDTTTELRLFTPYDLRLNSKIRYDNSFIQRGSGVQKESTLPGSIIIESVTTSAATHRGKSIKFLALSEFAHFDRAKVGGDTENAIFSENPKTDYAIWKAFSPSVKDYGKDGKIIVETSPREKGGEAYNQYCIAGGCEQEKAEEVIPDPQYQLLQLATWQARINEEKWCYEAFTTDFRKDPIGAAMEYGAHFGNPAGSFIQEEWLERAVQKMVPILYTNSRLQKFVIAIDPGGKAKKKKADTYAIAWGHSEGDIQGRYENENNILYYIDGMKGFDSKIVAQGGGGFIQEPVDPNKVMEFILDLIDKLGGRNYIAEIVYDQWDSSGPIATLQSLGLPAIETTFTNPYKSLMYGNYLQKLISNQIRVYGVDEEGWIARWKLENKYLQRVTQGNYTFYQHPSSGPVQHDDFCDCSSNLIHRLCLLATPTQQSIQQARRQPGYPIQVKRGPKPLMAGNLTRSNSLIHRR